MKAVFKFLAGGVGLAALASAAPAAAQYYPGYGYGYGGNVVRQVNNQVLGGSQYGYGVNSQAAVQRCAAAVEQRINRDYGNRSGGYGYGGYGGYGGSYNGYAAGNARVLGVTSVERRSNNGLRVRGVATANANMGAYGGGYGGYGGGYGGYGGGYAPQGELRFKCNIDYRGYITDIDLDRTRYSNYGYRRY
jgi:hypothetical protein